MDHDSVPFDGPRPSSHRIADVNQAYAEITRRGLEIMDEKIEHDPAYSSNESGHFAWDVSLLIRAACLAWRVTGEAVHIHQAARWAKHMADRTDEALNLTNWRGKSMPVWSSGHRYTAGCATLGTIGGVPIDVQGAADSVVFERPDETTAQLHLVRDRETVWSSPKASLLPEDQDYFPDVLARRSSVHAALVRGLWAPMDLTSLPAGRFTLKRQFAAHFVHTGAIARSLIAAAEALDEAGDAASGAAVTSDELFTVAERALLCHDDEIRIRSGQAWYITPEDFPGRRLGLELPHNQVVDAATSFLILGRHRKDKGFRNLGASLTRRFLGEIEAYEVGTLRHPWFYYPVDSDVFFGVTRDGPMAERRIPAVPRGEDSSHATIRVRALVEWKMIDSRLVPDTALSTAALTFRRFFMSKNKGAATLRWLPGDDKTARRRGLADSYSGAWGALAGWDTTIKRRINSMAYRHPPREIFGATVLSATEILAMNAGIPIYVAPDQSGLE